MTKKIFKENGFDITEYQEQQLQKYYDLLTEWNKKINLTAITEYKDVIVKHFVDSALLLKSDIFTDQKAEPIEKCSVLDLGTGAGFPGIVLAVLYPQYQYTLVDSLNKRIEFLHIIKEELELNQICLYHGRAEDFGRNIEFRDQYDFVVSRAVAELPVLLEYCIPFVKPEGYFVAYKGKKCEEEIERSQKAFQELDCEIKRNQQFLLSGEERYLLFVKKLSRTKEKYPRKAGKIKKNPLY